MLITTTAMAQIQIPDTMYSRVTVGTKVATITKTQEKGNQKITEVNKLNLAGAEDEIKKLTQDTAQYNQYLTMLNNQTESIRLEKIRINMMRREAIRYLRRLEEIIPSLR